MLLGSDKADSALPLALLFVAAFQSSDSVPGQLKAILSEISGLKSEIGGLEAQVASLANKVPRKFYLTRTEHNGAQALSACAAGYHMASVWEILDPSNLRYDTGLGITTGDSGFGPPSNNLQGWIRTGALAGNSVIAGFGNCSGWQSGNTTDFGTVVLLTPLWNLPSGQVVNPWEAHGFACSGTARVWCAQD